MSAAGSGAAAVVALKEEEKTKKNILIVGAGPGASYGVAKVFSEKGFTIGFVSLTQEEANECQKKFEGSFAYSCDAAKVDEMKAVCEKASQEMGPISVLHYNAAQPKIGGDILADDFVVTSCADAVNITCSGLLACVRTLREDLKKNNGAVLATVSGGGKFTLPEAMENMIAKMGVTCHMVASSAAIKLLNQLSHKLKDEVFVGQVIVNGRIKGTPFDDGKSPVIVQETIGEAFWTKYNDRSQEEIVINPPPAAPTAEAPAAPTAEAPAAPTAEAPAAPTAEAPAAPTAEAPAAPTAEAPAEPTAEAPAQQSAEPTAEAPAQPSAEAPAQPSA